ncbi:hypothetical protein PTTG_28092 [Puccinia triticina 1-1 BBBD Race 1]|uniref:Uncharacterized protein n=1 Tax=Puccinia triticina (isolate 1-1 / race 1 (BBBD)) TaxID=630390 RepID=A0A180GET1_PUCT1|nr:hypothetical protein PTTG_28092 [Puccinia triticina 1-1 BBBD Race 1]
MPPLTRSSRRQYTPPPNQNPPPPVPAGNISKNRTVVLPQVTPPLFSGPAPSHSSAVPNHTHQQARSNYRSPSHQPTNTRSPHQHGDRYTVSHNSAHRNIQHPAPPLYPPVGNFQNPYYQQNVQPPTHQPAAHIRTSPPNPCDSIDGSRSGYSHSATIDQFVQSQPPARSNNLHRQTSADGVSSIRRSNISIHSAPPLSPPGPSIHLESHSTSSQSISLISSQPDPELEALIAGIPSNLQFFLQPDVPFAQATIKKLNRIIQYIFPSTKFKGTPGKPFLYKYFKDHVAPLLAKYSAQSQESRLLHDEPRVDHINVNHFNPHDRRSTKKILSALIHRVQPNLDLSRLNKTTLISTFYKTYNLQPFSPADKFSVCPPPIPTPDHEQQERNEIRFALQCYCPNLFLPLECSKVELLAIYEIFILEELTRSYLVQENAHYYWFDPTVPPEYLISLQKHSTY